MINDPIKAWMNSAGRFPLLPKSEVIRLAKARDNCKPGSKQYLKIVNKICQHNLRLVPGIVRGYLHKRVQVDMSSDIVLDLLQQGYIGLRRAAEKFDATKGYTFSTYAYAWIKQSVSRWYACNKHSIYIPENCLTELVYIKRNGKRSPGKNGRMSEEVLNAGRRTMDMMSIDQRLDHKDDPEKTTIADVMSDENKVLSSESLPESTGMQRISKLMVECGLDLVTRDVIKNYGRRGRMSVVASKLKIPQNNCVKLYNEGMAVLKAKVEEKEACKARILADRLKSN